jgi:hypothetical protein
MKHAGIYDFPIMRIFLHYKQISHKVLHILIILAFQTVSQEKNWNTEVFTSVQENSFQLCSINGRKR